jgi:hypothetical protein
LLRSICLAAAVSLLAAPYASAVTVFSTDFDSTLAPEISPGTATLTGVQGYAGLGASGNQFGGSFLRTIPANTITLTLSNLPQHDSLSVAFLFAAIDSLDGTGTFPSGDFFVVSVDGVTIFNESFANATPSQIQSYVPPAGVTLARHQDLGFSGPGGFYTDSAYDMGADPILSNIPHTASSVTITFLMQGPGNQSLDDESWAIDNLRVSVNAVPEAGTIALLTASGLALGARRRAA